MTVLRRMREHLGACREVDEGCDVGDVDERSPHDLGERCTSTPHALSVSLSLPPFLPPSLSLQRREKQPGRCATRMRKRTVPHTTALNRVNEVTTYSKKAVLMFYGALLRQVFEM